jgi:hypothetical protein
MPRVTVLAGCRQQATALLCSAKIRTRIKRVLGGEGRRMRLKIDSELL